MDEMFWFERIYGSKICCLAVCFINVLKKKTKICFFFYFFIKNKKCYRIKSNSMNRRGKKKLNKIDYFSVMFNVAAN